MLTTACRRFRHEMKLGRPHPHRRGCAECEAFAAALETAAAAADRQLPEALRAALRAIPEQEALVVAVVEPLPELPLPSRLRARLRRIGQPGSRPPVWLLKPRYAVAASYLLTLVIGGAVGNPAAVVSAAAPRLESRARDTLVSVETTARRRVSRWESAAEAVVRRSRASLTSTFQAARGKLAAVAAEILPDDDNQPSTESEAADPKGDSDD